MSDYKFAVATVGVIAITGMLALTMKYMFKSQTKMEIARTSALEKLLETYGNQMNPEEFKQYAASFGLTDVLEKYEVPKEQKIKTYESGSESI